jgi:hypothetical protein
MGIIAMLKKWHPFAPREPCLFEEQRLPNGEVRYSSGRQVFYTERFAEMIFSHLSLQDFGSTALVCSRFRIITQGHYCRCLQRLGSFREIQEAVTCFGSRVPGAFTTENVMRELDEVMWVIQSVYLNIHGTRIAKPLVAEKIFSDLRLKAFFQELQDDNLLNFFEEASIRKEGSGVKELVPRDYTQEPTKENRKFFLLKKLEKLSKDPSIDILGLHFDGGGVFWVPKEVEKLSSLQALAIIRTPYIRFPQGLCLPKLKVVVSDGKGVIDNVPPNVKVIVKDFSVIKSNFGFPTTVMAISVLNDW